MQDRAEGPRAARRLNPYSKTLVLTTLYWPDEVRAVDELSLPEDEVDIKPAGAEDGRAARRQHER